MDLNPTSSNPLSRFKRLKEEIKSNDGHGSTISENKIGLRRGADAKLAEGIISEEQFTEIIGIIEKAGPSDYAPVMYVIPYEGVKDLVILPGIEEKAGMFSDEYQIIDLPGDRFEAYLMQELY